MNFGDLASAALTLTFNKCLPQMIVYINPVKREDDLLNGSDVIVCTLALDLVCGVNF